MSFKDTDNFQNGVLLGKNLERCGQTHRGFRLRDLKTSTDIFGILKRGWGNGAQSPSIYKKP
jgi:hypothetical protein